MAKKGPSSVRFFKEAMNVRIDVERLLDVFYYSLNPSREHALQIVELT